MTGAEATIKPLLILRDEDIFPEDYSFEGNDWQPTERIAVRAICLDDENKVALVGTQFRLLPGGGVETGESLIEAIKRECREEVGCEIEVGEEVAFIEEFRSVGKRHQITHCFLTHVIGKKGEPQTTQTDEIGMKVEWLTVADTIALLKEQIKTIPFKRYYSCFNVRAHMAFMNEFDKRNA